MEAPL